MKIRLKWLCVVQKPDWNNCYWDTTTFFLFCFFSPPLMEGLGRSWIQNGWMEIRVFKNRQRIKPETNGEVMRWQEQNGWKDASSGVRAATLENMIYGWRLRKFKEDISLITRLEGYRYNLGSWPLREMLICIYMTSLSRAGRLSRSLLMVERDPVFRLTCSVVN